jgi:hypothetical protein
MKNRLPALIVLAVLAVPLVAEIPDPAAFDKKVGGALLDGIARIFHEMAVSGSKDTLKQIEDFLIGSMNEARKAKEQNQIDAVFLARYQRVLGIIKMVIAPDPGGILVPIIDQELKRFVTEVLGEEFKGTGPGAIGQVANAIADEMVNLRLYMDNVEMKAKLRKEFDEKFSDAAPAKKK